MSEEIYRKSGSRRSRLGTSFGGSPSAMDWKQRRYVCMGLAIISVICFVLAGVMGWKFFHRYSEGVAIYNQVRELVPDFEIEMSEGSGGERSTMDFSSLLEMNPDCIGWIQIPGTDIDYPIVQGADNVQYLREAFTGDASDLGSIFADYRNDSDFMDDNTVLYGHDMWVGGSMFSQLTNYQDMSFFNEHPEILIHTLDGRLLRYQVFAVRIVDETDSDAYTRMFESDSQNLEYLSDIVSDALYDTMERPEDGQSLLTLSTCTNVRDSERLLVHGVLKQ